MAAEEKRNFIWLLAEHGFRILIGVFVGALIARHLGVKNFGYLMTAGGYAALIVPFVSLGLMNVLVSECVKYPNRAKFLLGSALLLQIPLGIILHSVVFLIYHLSGQEEISFLTLMVCFHLPFQSICVLQAYHQYKKNVHLCAKASTLAFFIGAGLRILCVYLEQPVGVFAFLLALETIIAFALIVLISRGELFFAIKFKLSVRIIKMLLKLSWVQVVMAFGLISVGRIDFISLQWLASDHELGIFSAAIRIAERVNFIPLILSAIFLPKVIMSRKEDEKLYEKNLGTFLDIHALIAILFAVCVTIFGEQVADIIYGETYKGTGRLLFYQAWVGVPFFVGMAKWNYLIIEKNLKDNLITIGVVIVLKMIFNMFFVPKYGALGVVFSSLIAYTAGFIFMSLCSSKTRLFGILQLRCLFPFHRIKQMRDFITK